MMCRNRLNKFNKIPNLFYDKNTRSRQAKTINCSVNESGLNNKIMNAIASFRLCTLSDDELLKKVDKLTDEMFQEQKVPDRHVPARPDADYDLLIGELLKRFDNRWIDATKQTPKMIFLSDFSENVLALCNGELAVMCYCYLGAEVGFHWANCHGQIDGEGDFDDDYEVTFWQPFPKIPTQ